MPNVVYFCISVQPLIQQEKASILFSPWNLYLAHAFIQINAIISTPPQVSAKHVPN